MKNQLIVLFAALLIFSSCIKKEANVVNLGLLNGPSSIGMVQSIENQSYYEGMSIHYNVKDNPQHLRALLQSGNMDMAILPMTMVYNMIENNVDIKIFAITGWGNLYMLSRDSIDDISSLIGQTISVPGEGQTPDLVTKFLLDYTSLQDKIHLNYTYPSPLLLTSALAIGKVENAILPEPLASLALSKDSTLIRSLDIAKAWQEALPYIPLVQSVFVVKTSFYDENKTWFKGFVDKLEANAALVQAQPLEALQLASKHELLPLKLASSDIIGNSHLDFVRTDIARDIERYLSTFYVLDEDFTIDGYIIH